MMICPRGALRDARSDVQEVLEERMEGKVREGGKVGNGNRLMASGIYTITQSQLAQRILNGKKEYCRKAGRWSK